jgi:flagellar hook-length control protein FliK
VPDFSSTVLPAMPAAPVAPVAAAPAPQATSNTADPAAGAVASFLNQLQAALGSLGLLPQPQAQAQPKGDATARLPLDAPADDKQGNASDSQDVLPEVLAALGFVPVPAMLQTLPTLTTTVASEAAPWQAGAPALTSTLPQPLLSAPSSSLGQQNTSAVDLPVAEQTQALAATQHETQQSPAPADKASAAPIELPRDLPAPQPQAIPQQPPLTMLTQQSALRAEAAPATSRPHAAHSVANDLTSASATAPLLNAQPLGTHLQQGATDSGAQDGNSDDASTTTEAVPSKGDAPVTNFANVASTTPQPVQAPADTRPAHVVGQIAHQAELYRLPGGRGVRIQLHPDDLGGVGVTIKYGASGGLELHMNVEHAATAELVQAGWNDLRDALSLQGISADRLVMSVSGSGDASFSGGSSDGASYRSDTGQMSFGQTSQQNQQPQEDARASRGARTSFIEAAGPIGDEPREAASASNSRIDYRA